LIHEMGILVCDAEWSEPFHVDVCQRVPTNPNRDAVQAGHPARARIDHRSYAERRVPLEPQNKIGCRAARDLPSE